MKQVGGGVKNTVKKHDYKKGMLIDDGQISNSVIFQNLDPDELYSNKLEENFSIPEFVVADKRRTSGASLESQPENLF